MTTLLFCCCVISVLDLLTAQGLAFTLKHSRGEPWPVTGDRRSVRGVLRGDRLRDAGTLTRELPAMSRLDQPPAASAAWPRWLSALVAAYAALRGFKRKLLGGAEVVALDPALPWAVRWELIKSRGELRSKGASAPRAFRSMLKESADTLEEFPALIVTAAVLAGDALRRHMRLRQPLTSFRRLGEAQALLFTAGKLHQGMSRAEDPGIRLLAGDFLFAEGQWVMAELGSLPAVRRTARMIRDVSDGTSKGGAAHGGHACVGALGVRTALRAAFLRAGTNFAMATSGAAWLIRAPRETVIAFRRYGIDLGCALEMAQYREDIASQDCALWLARSAKEALRSLGAQSERLASVRGMYRLADRVEHSCAASVLKLVEEQDLGSEVRGLSYGDFCDYRSELDSELALEMNCHQEEEASPLAGPGYTRDRTAEEAMEGLISAGLSRLDTSRVASIRPKEEGELKAVLETSLRSVGRGLLEVNELLDGRGLAKPAGTDMVREAVAQVFGSGGKRLRPALVLLVSSALGGKDENRRRVATLAASVEVLHSASLVHDDILDGADLRRGLPTVHVQLGERAAAMVGDFLFASAICMVAELDSLPVLVLICKVVADFGRGELAQSAVRFEAVKYSLEDYLTKSFYKTASLLGASCQAAAVLSGTDPSAKEATACYMFGAYIGLAFQVVDDVLDFTSSELALGKPALADLREGNLSAPILFAAQGGELEARGELLEALDRRLAGEGDLNRVLALVDEAGGVQKAKALARRFADLAIAEIAVLPAGQAREALRTFADFVVERSS